MNDLRDEIESFKNIAINHQLKPIKNHLPYESTILDN